MLCSPEPTLAGSDRKGSSSVGCKQPVLEGTPRSQTLAGATPTNSNKMAKRFQKHSELTPAAQKTTLGSMPKKETDQVVGTLRLQPLGGMRLPRRTRPSRSHPKPLDYLKHSRAQRRGPAVRMAPKLDIRNREQQRPISHVINAKTFKSWSIGASVSFKYECTMNKCC